jgi:hypothetical protein
LRKADLGQLESLYMQAEALDKEVYAEMRSNLLLVAGEHYSKSHIANYRTHVRESRELSDMQKLRLTKNHVHRVHRRYTEAVSRYAAGVTVAPAKENEMQDQKDAELNLAVMEDIKYRHKDSERVRKEIDDFVDIGEVACLILWDPNKGDFLGYAHQQVPDGEDPKPGHYADESGFLYNEEDDSPVADEDSAVFRGDFEFRRLYGFNMWRDTTCKDMLSSRFLGIREMYPTSKLKARYHNDPDKLKLLQNEQNQEFVIFDALRNGYDRAKGMSLLKQVFYRPCEEYPMGYFVIWTTAGILEEGEIPFGIFPIVWKGFDEHATAPRGRSIIKQARPYQAEINRAASQQAQTQITIGDDKLLYQAGTKLAPGALLPGVRGISYQGNMPTVLPGRDGSQFVNYIAGQIDELDKILDLNEIDVEVGGQVDPYAMLFRSAKQREKFSRYSSKFEEYRVEFWQIVLDLAKKYYPDDMLVPAVGSKEYVNLAEFRTTVRQSYRIHVEARDDTLETSFGRQLSIQHVLQYASSNLDKDDIGKLIRAMPYGNFEETFGDLTIDYDLAKNDMLAMERGDFTPAQPDDNHVYMIKKLGFRMRQPDFKFLNPQIQNLFVIKKQQHMQLEAKRQQQIIDAKNEYIPIDGPMIACDMYVNDPSDPTKDPKRARVPQTALDWLLKTLAAQGQDMQKLQSMDEAQQAQLAQIVKNSMGLTGGAPGQPHPGMPPGPPMAQRGGLPPGQGALAPPVGFGQAKPMQPGF